MTIIKNIYKIGDADDDAQVRWKLLQQPRPVHWECWKHDDKNINDKMMMILTMMKMRRYVDSYCNNPDQLNLSAQEMLKPAVEVFSNPPLFHTLSYLHF